MMTDRMVFNYGGSPHELLPEQVVAAFDQSSRQRDWEWHDEDKLFSFKHNLMITIRMDEDSRFRLYYGYQPVGEILFAEGTGAAWSVRPYQMEIRRVG